MANLTTVAPRFQTVWDDFTVLDRSLYLTKNLKESSKNYFERVLNSVKLIINDTNQKLPSNIFVMGQGLDKLLNSEYKI